MIFLNNIPYLLFSAILGNIFYISFISIFSWVDFYWYFYYLQLLFFILAFFIFKKYKKLFAVEKTNYFYLLFPYLLIIFLRLPIYTKVHDDLTYYLVAGEYTKNLWTNSHFLPTYAIYFYNALPLFYHTLVNFLGLRIALFISMFTLSIWMVSLNLRFKKLLKTKTQKYLADFFFISFPFWPHLMAIHGSFMTDFFSLVFILEAFYQFVNKEKDKTFALISFVIAGLVKQSSIFYVLPVFFYLILKNIRKINFLISVIMIVFFSSYFIKLYFEVGNPLLGGLYNHIFKSPLVQQETGPGLSSIFGGRNTIEKIIWPVWGQFSGRFGEGFVSRWARYYHSIFLILAYLLSIYYLLIKKRLIYFFILISFLLWSFDLGYSRWVIPLIAISWMIIVVELSFEIINKKLKKKYLIFLYLLIIILSVSSIKTDFGWRPYHNPKFFIEYFYLNSFSYLGKDRYQDFLKIYQNDFTGFEAISIIRSEKAYFYSFLGSLKGLRLISSADKKYYKNILNSSKVSFHIKNNIKNILNSKKVMVVFDSMVGNRNLLKNDYYLNNKSYNCVKMSSVINNYLIQNSFFDSIERYSCNKIN